MHISDGPTYLMMLNWLQKFWKKGILTETIKGSFMMIYMALQQILFQKPQNLRPQRPK
jgi:hypothetical protein